ncbi:SDR family NAD(P)-dependent oxidoreductase [Lysinimonas soli]|uniref:SDR family NAD(P)-dependent oxidoreductase n=1 Tax=Lysinimonas soli TaxID=1074233 RepID=A0ABW0NRN8_9MICO
MPPISTEAPAAKVAIVTGAGRGIGRAIAERLARDGYRVVAVDLLASNLDETVAAIAADAGSVEALALDVTDRAAVHAAFEQISARLERIDVVVNNAMWIRYQPLVDVEEATIDAMVAVGLKAVIWTMQAAYPTMIAQGGGVIVNVSSPAAVRGVAGSAIYSAVKGAVSSLTWQASNEFGRQGIRVNAVVPGAVPTEGARALVDDEGYELRARLTPLGRLGTPEDIANAVAFLVSDQASYINGHLLAVEGGLLAS